MGTNYFLFTRSKRLAHTHFASETEWGVTGEEDEFFPSGGKYVHITDCNPEEAEIWTPLNHLEYAQKEKNAVKRFRVEDSIRHDSGEFYSHSDEEYAIDWSKGDFR